LYDPFGDVSAQTGWTDPTLGFQGDFTDPTSDEVWMGARWYSGADAVFRSRDTVSGELQMPVSLNRYTYGGANPLRFWDPDGHVFLEGDTMPTTYQGPSGPPSPPQETASTPPPYSGFNMWNDVAHWSCERDTPGMCSSSSPDSDPASSDIWSLIGERAPGAVILLTVGALGASTADGRPDGRNCTWCPEATEVTPEEVCSGGGFFSRLACTVVDVTAGKVVGGVADVLTGRDVMDLDGHIVEWSTEFGVDPLVVAAIMKQESIHGSKFGAGTTTYEFLQYADDRLGPLKSTVGLDASKRTIGFTNFSSERLNSMQGLYPDELPNQFGDDFWRYAKSEELATKLTIVFLAHVQGEVLGANDEPPERMVEMGWSADEFLAFSWRVGWKDARDWLNYKYTPDDDGPYEYVVKHTRDHLPFARNQFCDEGPWSCSP
jgi:RHS repeat-associated protein